jgi:AAA+ superfamily predicted ATPase
LAFEFAQKKDAVLFFDEADTLLGARLSNVTQGIDNEVNSLRSTLLIELERFEGIVIFATNFERNYDKAFVSRITQHVCFELPDADGRRHIWDKFLVSGIPLEDERESLLSKLSDNSGGFSGRDIRTCMRLALPKAIHRCGNDEIKVSWMDFDSAIQDVRTQNYSVGTEIGSSRQEENRAALKMLGAKISNENSTNK